MGHFHVSEDANASDSLYVLEAICCDLPKQSGRRRSEDAKTFDKVS